MNYFSKTIFNNLILTKGIIHFKYATPFKTIEDILSNSTLEIRQFDTGTWKIGETTIVGDFVSSSYYAKSYIHNTLNLPMIKREVFSVKQKDKARLYAQKLLEKSKITVSPDDINSIYSMAGISDISDFEQHWNKHQRLNRLTIEETHDGDFLKIFIIKGKIVSICGLLPAFVIGNGVSSIKDLIASENVKRSKSILYNKYMINNISSSVSKDIIPGDGEVVKLKNTTKISNGAVLVDLTDALRGMFDGLTGLFDNILNDIDFMALTCLSSDFSKGWSDQGFKVREIDVIKAKLSELLSTAYSLNKVESYLSIFKINDNREVGGVLEKSCELNDGLLKSTGQIDILSREAHKKGLHVLNFDPSFLVLTDIKTNKKVTFKSSISNKTSAYIKVFAGDKFKTKTLLMNSNINTPKGFKTSVKLRDEAWEKAVLFNAPVVVKPLDGSGGEGVSTNITEKVDFDAAWDICANLKYNNILVEEYVKGNDYRVVVIGNKVCSVTQRIAASVVGDGINDIDELIAVREKERKSNPYLSAHPVVITDILTNYLSQQKLSLKTIPKLGEHVQLVDVVNIGAGGESIDRTDEIHPDWIEVAIKAKKAILDPFHVGLDIMAEDIKLSPNKQDWTIIEINTNPALGLPLFPKTGKPRNIAKTLLDSLYPNLHVDITSFNFSVYGKVQNTGFRKWLKLKCDLYSVCGFVKNHINTNRVDIVIKGPEATLEHILKICYQGPKAARVDKLCINADLAQLDFNGFEIID